MILAALDFEFGFHGRAFDYTVVEPVCGVLYIADGKAVTACPKRGMPWSLLEPYLCNPDILIAMHRGAFAERRVLQAVGLPWPDGHWWDTECAERVLHIAGHGDLLLNRKDGGPYSLLGCLGRRGMPVRDAVAKAAMQGKIGRLQFADSDLLAICDYCRDDCSDTLELARRQLNEFTRLPGGMAALYVGLLQPHLLRTADMTAKGILFDVASIRQIKANEERLLAGKQAELKSLGFAGDFSHPHEKLTVAPQNLNVVRTFENLGLRNMLDALSVYKTDVGKPADLQRRSLAGVFDQGHKSAVSFIRAVKDYHDLIALLQTDWEQYIDSDGCIRPAVVFPGTSSYRTQQIMPNPLMLPYFARPLFHARPGHVLLELDFKCQEVGLAANFFGDEKLLNIYNTFAECLYCEIGAAMGIYPAEQSKPASPETDPGRREEVKTAILAMQYGGQAKAIQEQTNLPPERAREVVAAFKKAFPDLHKGKGIYLAYTRGTGTAVNRAGLVRAYRPCTMKNGAYRDTALSYCNYPIQSAGGAILMETLADLAAWTNPLLSMHDAILLEVPKEGVKETAQAVEAAMGGALGKLFPRLRCRCERQSAHRYHKKDPGSLHHFCKKLGLTLDMPVEST